MVRPNHRTTQNSQSSAEPKPNRKVRSFTTSLEAEEEAREVRKAAKEAAVEAEEDVELNA